MAMVWDSNLHSHGVLRYPLQVPQWDRIEAVLLGMSMVLEASLNFNGKEESSEWKLRIRPLPDALPESCPLS